MSVVFSNKFSFSIPTFRLAQLFANDVESTTLHSTITIDLRTTWLFICGGHRLVDVTLTVLLKLRCLVSIHRLFCFCFLRSFFSTLLRDGVRPRNSHYTHTLTRNDILVADANDVECVCSSNETDVALMLSNWRDLGIPKFSSSFWISFVSSRWYNCISLKCEHQLLFFFRSMFVMGERQFFN